MWRFSALGDTVALMPGEVGLTKAREGSVRIKAEGVPHDFAGIKGPVWLQIFLAIHICTFILILQRAKVSKYHQSIKIRFSTQNIKISAVSTPNFARISPFFCIFRDLPEYIGENASKCKKKAKSFAVRTKFRKFSENQQKTVIF